MQERELESEYTFPSKVICIFVFEGCFLLLFFLNNAFVAYMYIIVLCSYSPHIALSFFYSSSSCGPQQQSLLLHIIYIILCIYAGTTLIYAYFCIHSILNSVYSCMDTYIFIFKLKNLHMRESMQHFFIYDFFTCTPPLPFALNQLQDEIF